MKRQNLRTVSLVVITFTYLLGGAAIFGWLESESEVRQREYLELIEGLIRRKYNISEDDYKVLWTTIIRSAPHKAGTQWKFPGAFYFATTVVTTIGYGHSTPSTLMGRSFCMLYALIGIPLGLVMFQCIGERLNALVTVALRKLKSCTNAKNQEVTATNKVAVVSVLSLILMTSMAWVFAKYERWDYFDALYYCFITLTTIGFGDYVALQKDAALQSKPEYVIMSLVFILFGLSVVSSAVNLLVLKFLTLNTEDERRDEWLRSTAAMSPILLEGDVITSPAGKFEYVGGPRPAALDSSAQQPPPSTSPPTPQQQPPLASDELVVWHFRGQTQARRRRKFGPQEQQVVPRRLVRGSFEGDCSSEGSGSSPTGREIGVELENDQDETVSETGESLQQRHAQPTNQSRAGRANSTSNNCRGHDNGSDSLVDEEDDNEEAPFEYYLHRQRGGSNEAACRCQCEFELDHVEQQQRWQPADLPPAATLPPANSLTSFVGPQTKPDPAQVSPLPFASSEGGLLRRSPHQDGRTTCPRKPLDGANCDGPNELDEQHCRASHFPGRPESHIQNYHHEAAAKRRHFRQGQPKADGHQLAARVNRAPSEPDDRQRQVSGGALVSSAPVANQSSCSCSWVSLASQSNESLKKQARAATAKCNFSSSCLLLDAGGLIRSHSQDRPGPAAASSHPHHRSSGGVSLERRALVRLTGGVTTRALTGGANATAAPPPPSFRSSLAVHGSEPQDGPIHEVTNASDRHQNESAKTMISSQTAAGTSWRQTRRRSFTDDDLDYERRLQSWQQFRSNQWQTTNSNNGAGQDLEPRPSGISETHEMQSRDDGSNPRAGIFYADLGGRQQKQPRPLTAPNPGERRQPTCAPSARRKSGSSSGQKQHKTAPQKLVCRCCCQHAECIEYAFETASKQRGHTKASSPPQGAASESANKPPAGTGKSSAQAGGGCETYSESSRTFQQSTTTPREICDKSRTTKPNTPSPPVSQPDLGSNFSAHSEPAADESSEAGHCEL